MSISGFCSSGNFCHRCGNAGSVRSGFAGWLGSAFFCGCEEPHPVFSPVVFENGVFREATKQEIKDYMQNAIRKIADAAWLSSVLRRPFGVKL